MIKRYELNHKRDRSGNLRYKGDTPETVLMRHLSNLNREHETLMMATMTLLSIVQVRHAYWILHAGKTTYRRCDCAPSLFAEQMLVPLYRSFAVLTRLQ